MLQIGTCSWKFDSWKGIIYPEKVDIDYIKEYSKHYKTVEIDQLFWSLFSNKRVLLLKDTDIKAYTKSVPDNF